MGRKVDSNKQELAYILYMGGVLQKEICERITVTPKTLLKWIEANGWKEKRAAKTITRGELVNKTLIRIHQMLEDKDTEVNADSLSKLATAIEKFDKRDTAVVVMDVFIEFGKWIQSEATHDREIDLDFIKRLTKYQDKYVTQKMAK